MDESDVDLFNVRSKTPLRELVFNHNAYTPEMKIQNWEDKDIRVKPNKYKISMNAN